MILNWHQILKINTVLFPDLFFAVIEVIYFTNILHLSFSAFATITSISILISMILEIPTGIISDKFGRRKMLIFGNIITILGMIFMIVTPVLKLNHLYNWILLAQIIIITGNALASGNFEVLIYDLYKKSDNIKTKDFKTLSAHFFSEGAIIAAIAGLVSTIIFNLNPYLPLILDILILFIKTLTFYFLPASSNKIQSTSKHKSIDKHALLPILLTIILFSLIFSISRYTYSLYQPLMTSNGIPLIYYGILSVTVNLTVFFIIHNQKFKISKQHIPQVSIGVLLFQFILLGIPFIHLMLNKIFLFIIIFSIMQILRIISEGLSSYYLNKAIEGNKNKTFYFSLYQTLSSLFLALFFKGSGILNNLTQNYIFTYVLICVISIIAIFLVQIFIKKWSHH